MKRFFDIASGFNIGVCSTYLCNNGFNIFPVLIIIVLTSALLINKIAQKFYKETV